MNERIREFAEQCVGSRPYNTFDYEKFAKLVRADEREACARVCDVLSVHPKYASDITKLAAQAIRARGER